MSTLHDRLIRHTAIAEHSAVHLPPIVLRDTPASGITNGGSSDIALFSENGVLKTKDSADTVTTITPASKKCQTLETVCGLCDGRSIVTDAGTIALQDVTAVQAISGTTFVDLTGSSISYTPPSGTTQVEYSFSFHLSKHSDYTVIHSRLMLDDVEVEAYRRTYGVSVSFYGMTAHFRAVIHVDDSLASDSVSDAKLKSWTSSKTLKLQVRGYDSKQMDAHDLLYWDGTSANGTLVRPTIKVVSLGTTFL